MGDSVVLNEPGTGWGLLAADVAARLPVIEVDAVWVFRAIHREGKEWGTALVSRLDGERRRLYTARYVHTLKGKERGQFSTTIEELGSGPVETVPHLLAGLERRLDDDAPTSVPPDTWFATSTNGPPRQG
jgi:hypothetical protein